MTSRGDRRYASICIDSMIRLRATKKLTLADLILFSYYSYLVWGGALWIPWVVLEPLSANALYCIHYWSSNNAVILYPMQNFTGNNILPPEMLNSTLLCAVFSAKVLQDHLRYAFFVRRARQIDASKVVYRWVLPNMGHWLLLCAFRHDKIKGLTKMVIHHFEMHTVGSVCAIKYLKWSETLSESTRAT